ncbi:MAG: NAD(P)/FAD-dependent oxidoreductase [Gallionella sp.]|jgi:sulfide:quinone oxidoreductase|nr:NAD(P)/FAD-dependent oxidoreductase [Gallionella sp.]
MARVVILGAGISGHTAALHLQRQLKNQHQIVMVSPNANWNWIPSNIWVGVGKMSASQVRFPLAPIYKRKHIDFRQAKAVAIHPEGDAEESKGFVEIVYTDPVKVGDEEKLTYDYLIVATGPELNFAATPGLGPEGNSSSVCTSGHAEQSAAELEKIIEALKAGERKTLVIGMGHGTCTCEGAAFEYTFNVEHELRERGVRDLADVVYLSNEYDLGDLGVGGMIFDQNGFETSSKLWTESLFRERGVRAVLRAHVEKVEPGVIHYETLDGSHLTLDFDFAMLLPPFRGVEMKAYGQDGGDITDDLFASNRFLRVDADYETKPYEEWAPEDWPKTYQCPRYDNVFGVGIAFAPPHAISQPRKSPNGTIISPAPPRTGMPSGVMGRTVALSIVDRLRNGSSATLRTASMAAMGAACIASAGTGLRKGSAAAITMFPIIPDRHHFPGSGRDLTQTTGEIGLSGHWTKLLLHYLFIYKAKARLGWFLIPE